MDHYVGQLLAELDQIGLADDTLVVLTSDNGGHPEFVANAPLRGSKWNLYEGGIRVPWIARWPGSIPSGTICDAPIVGYDLAPTLADIAGGQMHSDGQSIRPWLESDNGKSNVNRSPRSLYWHFPFYHPESGYDKALERIGVNDFAVSKTRPQSAIRRGQFKLIAFYEQPRCELFDVQNDPGEQYDLAPQMPALAEELQDELRRLLKDADARFPILKSDN
jgi:uncharacterized sulfatase